MTDKYILFAHTRYYPHGGALDYVGSFDTEIEAKDHYDTLVNDSDRDDTSHPYSYSPWAHIALKETMEITQEYEEGFGWKNYEVPEDD